MKKTIFALAAAATIAVEHACAPTPADARWRGGGVGLGILGGVVAGAIIGSAIASHPGYYSYDDYGEYAGAGLLLGPQGVARRRRQRPLQPPAPILRLIVR